MMELQQQVCSLELARRLKELGVSQKSIWNWCGWGEEEPYLSCSNRSDIICSAFTVAELGLLLPKGYHSWVGYYDDDDIWCCTDGANKSDQTADTEADARAKMLIYLIENKLIDVNQ